MLICNLQHAFTASYAAHIRFRFFFGIIYVRVCERVVLSDDDYDILFLAPIFKYRLYSSLFAY